MKIISIPGGEISEERLRDLYQFRIGILPLKAETNESKDYAYFTDYGKTSQQIFIFQDKNKEVRGFYFCRYLKIKLPSKTFIRMEPEYGIIDKAYRGQVNNFLPLVKVMLYLAFRYPFYPIYFVGTAYPSSYISLRKQIPTVFDSIDGLNETDKAIFMNYVDSIKCKASKTSFIYENPTIPEFSKELLERYEKSPYYARYNDLNPEWSEGKSLVIVCPVRKRDLALRVLKSVLGIKNK